MSRKKNKLQELQDEMHIKCDKFPQEPSICQEFGWALLEISRFTRITIESYSAEGKRFGNNIKRKNRELKEKGSKSLLYSSKGDIMASDVIPNFYYMCHISLWGILEEFLRDALFLSITGNIPDINKTRKKGIKKIDIQKEELADMAMEKGRNDINHMSKSYKNLLNVDLKENKSFVELFNMRNKRNVTAHSGFLFGYDSVTKKKNKTKDFEDEILDIANSAGMEFIKADAITNNEGEKVLPDSWYVYDPTDAKTSQKLEEDFCKMVQLAWELGYFVSKKLFVSRKKSL